MTKARSCARLALIVVAGIGLSIRVVHAQASSTGDCSTTRPSWTPHNWTPPSNWTGSRPTSRPSDFPWKWTPQFPDWTDSAGSCSTTRLTCTPPTDASTGSTPKWPWLDQDASSDCPGPSGPTNPITWPDDDKTPSSSCTSSDGTTTGDTASGADSGGNSWSCDYSANGVMSCDSTSGDGSTGGDGSTNPGSALQSVPEPASFGLLSGAIIAALARRRRSPG